jgi:hypothetical protein
MRTHFLGIVATVLAGGVVLGAGQRGQGTTPAPWPLSNPIREHGSSITGAFEGWFYDKDGAQNLLLGYFNRNTKQELDIPVGPANRIEPDGPDLGQPTHFLANRQFGVFSIKLPKGFGAKELTWTLVANGQTNTITMHTKPDWIVSPFEDPASKNTPPTIRFDLGGATTFAGPPTRLAATYTATAGVPLEVAAWVSDEGPKVNVPEPTAGRSRGRGASAVESRQVPALTVGWSLFRGPAAVAFSNPKPAVDKELGGKATTNATFTEPGEYVLRLQANDSTGDGGGGFQCCWTNAHVAVSVKAPLATSER